MTKRLVIATFIAAVLTAGICSVMFITAAPGIMKFGVMAVGIPLAFVLVAILPEPQGQPLTPGTGEAQLGMLLATSAIVCWFLLLFVISFAALGTSRAQAAPREPTE